MLIFNELNIKTMHFNLEISFDFRGGVISQINLFTIFINLDEATAIWPLYKHIYLP